MYKSGYIVQNIKNSQYCLIDDYYGVTKKESWPLEISESIQANLEKQWMEDFFSQNPCKRMYEFIFDLYTLECYLEICKKKGIQTRVLFLETCDVHEELEDCSYTENKLLGYELIYTNGFDYSALCDEIDLIEKAGLKHSHFPNSFALSRHAFSTALSLKRGVSPTSSSTD